MNTVLLVEDDATLLAMYERAFKLFKVPLVSASNGEEGLQKAKSFKPSLILLDIMMPVIDGIEVLRRLKADEETKAIPVIMMTNLTDSKQLKIALDLGAISYLVKSETEPDKIIEIVKSVINPQ